MNNESNSKEINKELYDSPHKKPFLSIDSEFSVYELYKILLKNPYLVNTEDEKNETFLSYAIKRNNNAIINLILTSPLLNLTYQNNNGNTYLHLAVIQQNLKLVQKLLDKGIFIDIQNNDGNTALHLAYYINNLHIIKELINCNIDFCIKNKKGLVAEEIDPISDISDINEIAGYEVILNKNMNLYEEEFNEESFNLNLKFQKIDSNNSGETKYKSHLSKEKMNYHSKSNNINNNFGICSFNTNKVDSDKNKRISLNVGEENSNIQSNNINNFLNNEKIDIKNNNRDSYRNITNNNIESENGKNNKTIDNNNNFSFCEEPIDQNFDISKNIISNFLENNSINNNGTFFLNEKGDNNSIISNIPI